MPAESGITNSINYQRFVAYANNKKMIRIEYWKDLDGNRDRGGDEPATWITIIGESTNVLHFNGGVVELNRTNAQSFYHLKTERQN